jgi:Cation efflux family
VATAIAAFIAIRISLTPADREHPYGHSKAEYLSAVLEGVLIIVAAFSILREAYLGFLHPKSLETPVQGLVLNGTARGQSGHDSNGPLCRLMTLSGHSHTSVPNTFELGLIHWPGLPGFMNAVLQLGDGPIALSHADHEVVTQPQLSWRVAGRRT